MKQKTTAWTHVLAVLATAAVGCTGCPSGDKAAPPAAPAAPSGTAPPPPPAAPSGPAAVAGFGSIKGRVLVTKPQTPPAPITVTSNPEVCGPTHDPGSLKIGEGGALETCVVYVKGPAAPADWKPGGEYEIDQKTCHYSPRVLLVPLGATVTFKSSDPVLHNVKSAYKGFNQAVTKDTPQKLVCDQADFADLQCNVHPFMAGMLVVQENPWYALTDASGAYKLDKVPAGTWKIFARHEVLKKNTRDGITVTVEPDKETVLDLKFD